MLEMLLSLDISAKILMYDFLKCLWRISDKIHEISPMKIILTLAICFMVIHAEAQQNDSLSARLDRIELNLQKCNKQHRTGVWLTVAGLALLTTGLLIEDSNEQISSYAYAGGTLLFVAGWIVTLDSQKYIGRAGGRTRKK
jgi:hypothetical protein